MILLYVTGLINDGSLFTILKTPSWQCFPPKGKKFIASGRGIFIFLLEKL